MAGIGKIAGICASINRDQDRDRDPGPGFHFLVVLFGTGRPEMLGPPLWDNVERNLNSLFIMNSAGEEDEEQVDYGEDSGGENDMSFNGPYVETAILNTGHTQFGR